MTTAWEAGANLKVALGGCPHEVAEPVVISTGEVVAAVCVKCLASLPPSWGCTDCEYVDDQRLCDPFPVRQMALPCPPHRMPFGVK